MVEEIPHIIINRFDEHCRIFADITRRAPQRFAARDWKGGRRDTLERLGLYSTVVQAAVEQLKNRMGDAAIKRSLWQAAKPRFFDRIKDRCNGELACTFYNSVSRKILDTVGFEPDLAFSSPPVLEHLFLPDELFFFQEDVDGRISAEVIEKLLLRYGFPTPFMDLAEDTRRCALRIEEIIAPVNGGSAPVRIEMVRAPFFRGMSAYLVGRMASGDRLIPLVFSIHNTLHGLRVDAVLTTVDQVRILFSFSRAYFHVQVECPFQLVSFLRQLMPKKRVAELYIGLGYHKHGKTELYRDLLMHQKVCSLDRFDISPGEPGMVMIAFNMPNDDIIYKLIRDRFDSPKKTTPRQVMEKYEYVFKHDRAGRLLDVQTFENLQLEDGCFTPRLLEEVAGGAQKAASVSQGNVILEHAYVERRVTPLDVFLQSAGDAAAGEVVLDYGQAIKDLARVNIFPGDMLLKNFGVTRLGRVVFYDYDELQPLTECNFRKLPRARRYEDDLDAEPWFMVAENDVFPEEMGAFLGLAPHLRDVFLEHHGDLLTPEFWWDTQDQIRAGIWIHIRPYSEAQRLYPEK